MLHKQDINATASQPFSRPIPPPIQPVNADTHYDPAVLDAAVLGRARARARAREL